MKKYIVLLLLLCNAAWAGIRLGDLQLTKIVVAKDAPDTVKLAARDLQEFVEKVSGVRLNITESVQGKGNIILGENQALVKDLPPEGFRIAAKDGNLYISGRDQRGVVYGIRNPWNRHEVYNPDLKLGAFGEAGTLYGVYRFLEVYAGVRFYMPREIGTVVPKRKIQVPANTDLSDYPKFSYRHPWICNFAVAPENALWYRRAGFGGKAPVQIIDFFEYITRKLKDHPEYFALVDGERDFTNKCAIRGGGHLCFNAPGCKEAVAEIIKEYFRTHPEHNCFPLTPGDGLRRCCECPKCKAEQDFDKPNSDKFSNHVWKFVNDVTAIVAKDYPDRMVGCLAYDTYLGAPDRIEKLHPNVAVMICYTRNAMASPAYLNAMHKRVEAWQTKTSNRLYGWNYYLHCWIPWRELPVFFPTIIQEDLQYMRKKGFAGEFIEAESWRSKANPRELNYPATQHLNLYLTAKLYWNPDADLKAMLDEYYTLFYGPAAKPMKQFFELSEKYWMDAQKRSKSTSGIDVSIYPTDVFPPQNLETLRVLLNQASALAKNSPYKERVAMMQKEFGNGRRSLVAMVRNEKPVLKVMDTKDKIKVDGILDEPTWSLGNGSTMITKMGENAPHRTYILARHDQEYLYFAFIVHEQKMDKLKVTGRGKDYRKIYLDDCVEIYLNHPNGKAWQFIISPGAVWDAQLDKIKPPYLPWDSGIIVAHKINGERLVIEAAIPMKSVEAVKGGSFKANFYRSRVVDEGQTFSTWSPTFTERHNIPREFGTLVIE